MLKPRLFDVLSRRPYSVGRRMALWTTRRQTNSPTTNSPTDQLTDKPTRRQQTHRQTNSPTIKEVWRYFQPCG